MPELFIEKYNTYKIKEEQKDEDLKIQLFKNFRSRENILKFTNLIFQNIMSETLGDIDYNISEYLNLGADYDNSIKQNLNAEIHIIDTAQNEEKTIEFQENEENDESIDDNDERIEDSELEAKFVANKIKELIENKFQVWDRKQEKYRDIKYKDIVILLRSTSNLAPIYEQELINLEIPTFSDSSQEYLESIEIQTIMSLLKIIDNPIQDIPLVTVLRSYIGKFTDNDLIQIRLSDKNDNFYICMEKAVVDVDDKLKNKIQTFFNNLNKWRKEKEYLSLDELIWKIYSDTGFYNYVGLMPNGILRQANLKMLFQKAKQYESSNFKGLYNFINFIDKLKMSSGDMGSAKIIGENDDVVRIMSIHKSKGLEFPVVFLSSTNKQINLNDLNQNVLLHQEIGIGAKYIDYDKQVQYDTLSKLAIRNKIYIETLSEEMRILYVALTRAKEKLFITGLNKNYEENAQKIFEQVQRYNKIDEKINPILVKRYKKYLDWILLVYQYEKENIQDYVELNVHKKQEILENLTKKEKEDSNIIEKLENTKMEKESLEKIETILNYKYPNLIDTIIPTKTSVTAIKQLQNEKVNSNDSKSKNSKSNKENKENIKKGYNEVGDIAIKNIEEVTEFAKPKFLIDTKEEKITSAKKGTLIHMCLQRLNEKVEYDINKINELIQELEMKKIITSKEAENINPNKILQFTKSNIWKELKEAKEIQKEKPFYINIEMKKIITSKEAENINPNKILQFTKSNIWKELKEAKEIQKEKPFYINIPAKEIYKEETEENILVQGIIDLYYIDKFDKLKLVDYKTDYVENNNEKQLMDKYRNQLELYSKALEESFGKKVDKKYIYSVYLGKEIEF